MAARADSTGAPAMPLAPISSNIIPFNRGGCPEGVEPRQWRKALKARVQQHLGVVTSLLRLLDDMDGDFDLEDGGDLEPSLGAAGVYLNGSFESDLELDDMDHEGDELDAREGDELDRGEADWGDYDSGAPIEGGGSGDL